MRKLIYFSIINLAFSTRANTRLPFIRNTEIPICTNCLYFIEHTNNYPYDAHPDDKHYGRCRKFGEVNLITGSIEYDFAKECRTNIKKCGISGTEYEPKIKH